MGRKTKRKIESTSAVPVKKRLKEFTVDLKDKIVWARIPRCPVMWPVQVCDVDEQSRTCTVHVKSDEAEFIISTDDIQPFSLEIRKAIIDTLKRKKMETTVKCFTDDFSWALATFRKSADDDTMKTTSADNCTMSEITSADNCTMSEITSVDDCTMDRTTAADNCTIVTMNETPSVDNCTMNETASLDNCTTNETTSVDNCTLNETTSGDNCAMNRTTSEDGCTMNETTSVDNCTTNEATSVDNCTTNEATSVDNCTTNEATSVDNCTMNETTSVDKCTTNEATSVDNCTTNEATSVDSCTTNEATSVDNCTMNETTSGDNCTTNETTSVDNCTTNETTSVDNCTTNEATSVDNCTTNEATSVDNCTSNEATSVDNCTTNEAISVDNCTTNEATSVDNCAMNETTSVDKCTTNEATSVDNCTTNETTSVDNCTTNETTSVDSCTTNEATSVDNCTTNETPSVDNCTTDEATSVDNCTTNEATSVDNCTTNEATSVDNCTTNEATSVDNCTTNEATSVDNCTTNEATSVDNCTTNETISVDNCTTNEATSVDNCTTNEATSVDNCTTNEATSGDNCTMTTSVDNCTMKNSVISYVIPHLPDQKYIFNESDSETEYAPSNTASATDEELEYDSTDDDRRNIKMNTHDTVNDHCMDSDSSEVYPVIAETFQLLSLHQPIDPEMSDDDVDECVIEDEILRDNRNSKIYISKVLRSETTKAGNKKKHARVYNSYQYCGLCNVKVSNFSQHIQRNKVKHASSLDIAAILTEPNEKHKQELRTLLRGKFNNKHNMQTLRKGCGEIFLERRPFHTFNLEDYGPCPGCLLWMGKKLIRKHQKGCAAHKESDVTQSSSSILTQSDTISGRIHSTPSSKLVKEVFMVMHMDDIGKIARNDKLIVQLGNQWMEKSVGNKLKRGSYTSQIIRLVGRLLLNLRKVSPLSGEDESMWNYLKPCHFEAIVQATLMTASPAMDDEDDLEKPSNAVKLGFDIKRLCNGKIGMAIIHNDKSSRTDAEDLLKIMDVYWGTRVTKLSRVLLEERHYNKENKLPEPEDIEQLNKHLGKSIGDLDLTVKTFANFIHVAEVISAKLLMYNRRRTGELQAIRVADYTQRQQGGSSAHILGECTEFEKRLLESQEVMTVRGKTGRGVPVIFPLETKKGLAWLTDPCVRQLCGIEAANVYVFAARGENVVRAYDALTKACRLANLKAPELITSTNLRKYMATVTQVLDLKEHELQWVLNHLGHTLDVHKIHYRCTSNDLERTQIAKILLLQDHDKLGQFRNKTLQEIQLHDIVLGSEEQHSAPVSTSVSQECSLVDDYDGVKVRKLGPSTKVAWTEEEEAEIRQLFKNNFRDKRRPKPADCIKAINKSKINGGIIMCRKKDVLKKKVFRMIDKL